MNEDNDSRAAQLTDAQAAALRAGEPPMMVLEQQVLERQREQAARRQAERVDAAFAEPTVIRPTVGRIVWYWPHGRDRNASIVDLSPVGRASQPMSATVCYVHGDRLVNLLVTDHVGRQHTRPEVQLVQEGDIRPAYGVAAYAAWMPYQTGQAKRERAAVAPAQGQA